MKPTLLVMAAGMGSRYGGVKQIDPVGPEGEALLDYSVFDAIRSGFGKIVFVIRKEIEADVREFLGRRFEDRIPTFFVFQELDSLPGGFAVPEGRRKPWGTGQAVLCAREAVAEPFAVINADDFYGRDAFRVMAEHLEKSDPRSTDFSMVGYRLANTLSEHGSVSRGVCALDADGCLGSVTEHLSIRRTSRGIESLDPERRSDFSGEEIVSMNLFGFTPEIFPLLEEEFRSFLASCGGDLKAECYIPKVVDTLIAAGKARVKVLRSQASWFGITYREDKPLVQKAVGALVEKGEYPPRLW